MFEVNWSSTQNDSLYKPDNLVIDKSFTNRTEFYASLETEIITNTWSHLGTYYLRIIARDRCIVDGISDGNSTWPNAIEIKIVD